MELGLIKLHAQLDYLPPRASLLTSTCDQPSKTRAHKPNIHCTKREAHQGDHIQKWQCQNPHSWNTMIPEDNRLVTRKEQIRARFPDVFEGIENSQANLQNTIRSKGTT